ncbi:MAG: SAM-dependent methyltransferase, partial [Verrucomicrobia bacterium]
EARRLGARLDERIVAEGSFLKSELYLLNRKLLQLQTFEKGKESEVPAAVSQGQHNLDAFYVAFENRFRGDRQLVKDRQQVYLPYLRFLECSGEDKAILDLGCGRGEWLELLQENGFSCAGVDSNAIMVAQCQERQLPAIEKDVLSFLGEQKDGVYGAVTAFHLLEHLPPIILLDLVKEVFRVLQAGGIAIFETPNPDNLLVGSNRFYLDPTHVRPLPKPLLEFSLILAGFKKVEIRSLQPDAPVDFDKECPKLEEFINRMFFGDQDYCAIAHK